MNTSEEETWDLPPPPVPEACACPTPEWMWLKQDCNERGWHCTSCRRPAPGDPPGYRPDLDAELARDKVDTLLMELHYGDLVYVSNSDHGDWLASTVAVAARSTECYDQAHLLLYLLEALTGDSTFWRDQGREYRAKSEVKA